MSHAPQLVFTVPTIASGATLSSSAFLGNKSYSKVFIVVPTMTSGTDVYVKGCESESGTYRRIYDFTSIGTIAEYKLGSATTNCIIPVPAYAPYIKIELSTAMTATQASFKLICSD